MFNDTPATNTFESESYTLAFVFRPETDIYVTHLRAFSGVKVSLWSEEGTELASATTASPGFRWVDLPVNPPAQLTAGRSYRLGLLSDQEYGYILPSPTRFAHGSIGENYLGFGDEYPTNLLGAGVIYLVDLAYTLGPPSIPLSVMPTNSGVFSNGVWAGTIALLEPANNAIVTAIDAQQFSGFSNPFDVLAGGPGDTDGDGLPDAWEDAHQFDRLNPNDAQLDADGDGLSNLREYLAGTDPRDPASVLRVAGLEVRGSDVRVTFRAVPGKTYQLERAAALGSQSWTVVKTFPADTAPNMLVIDTGSATNQAFYRIRLAP
jgi:hypothetical protein